MNLLLTNSRWCRFCLLCASVAWPQIAVSPQPIYEGQIITAIDLIGNPRRDVEPLPSLVAQKAGEHYSEATVQASIAALGRSGQFSKVKVEVIPDTCGCGLHNR